ncbi:MAG: UDP-glucose 4-epimerase GalE [Candidatus Krumholzibacteriia bacterium]
MRILVTGGAGYIGSITADHLLERGHEVEILDSLVTGHRDALPAVTFHAVDLRDRAALDGVFDRPFDAVLHFAAFSLVGESVQQPLRYWDNNVGAMLALLDRVARGGASRFVFSSSAAVYGEPDRAVIPEDAPLAPINPYGHTKAAMEWALADLAAVHGVSAVALRYFNAAGAWGGRGEDHEPETHLVPRLLRAAADPTSRFAIFGDDYPTPDGTCVRDFIHVRDLATAHAAAVEWAERPGFCAINLGTGRGCSVREMVAAAGEVTGRPLDPPREARRAGDPARLVAAVERARSWLGWRAEHSDVATILADAWRWHADHPHGYRERPRRPPSGAPAGA